LPCLNEVAIDEDYLEPAAYNDFDNAREQADTDRGFYQGWS
jgi:hypothetical protein